MDIKRIGAGAHYSEVTEYGGILYLSGQVNMDSDEIRGQSKAIFAQIDALLEANGSDREHILFVTLYLSDAEDFAGMNAEWDAWLPENNRPARACIITGMALPGILLEVVVTAAKK